MVVVVIACEREPIKQRGWGFLSSDRIGGNAGAEGRGSVGGNEERERERRRRRQSHRDKGSLSFDL